MCNRPLLAAGMRISSVTGNEVISKNRHNLPSTCRAARRLVITACAAGFVLGVSGCAELPPGALKERNEAEAEYRAQRYEAAASRLDNILRDYPNHRGCDEAYYLRALCRAQQSNRSGAIADTLACIKNSMTPALIAKAHATAGALLYETGQTAEALPHLSAALKGLPDAPPADLVRYHYAACLQREGRWRDARAEFDAIAQRYPNNTVAGHARRAKEWPHDYFAIQCGTFRDQASASKYRDQLSMAGLTARTIQRKINGESLCAVCVGTYARYEQAQAALPQIQRKATGATIVP